MTLTLSLTRGELQAVYRGLRAAARESTALAAFELETVQDCAQQGDERAARAANARYHAAIYAATNAANVAQKLRSAEKRT